MISKKTYAKPEVKRIALDISLVLMQPSGPDPLSEPYSKSSKKSSPEPFASPFDDKTFD